MLWEQKKLIKEKEKNLRKLLDAFKLTVTLFKKNLIILIHFIACWTT